MAKYEEIFTYNLDSTYISEVDCKNKKIYYRLPLGSFSPKWWICLISHEHIHASSPENGTLKIPEWMIDEILSYIGLKESDGEWIIKK